MGRTHQRVLSVTAPSRLHFGLFAFGGGHERQFGGVGLMIDRPMTRLRFGEAAQLELSVRDEIRVRRSAETWLALNASKFEQSLTKIEQLPVAIRQISSPEPHVGLGSGTQLALSVAAGLNRWFDVARELTIRDAAHYGRAKRSAVGSYGFFLGGLIVDQGKNSAESIGSLEQRIELPHEWRIVLVCPRGRHGPSGKTEDQLFETLPAIEQNATTFLREWVQHELFPAAKAENFAAFSDALYEFGVRAGACYRSVQSGSFKDPEVGAIVDSIRELGVSGVGQSSWGPCVFALCESRDEATTLEEELRRRLPVDRYWMEVTAINHSGHSIAECCDQPITMERLPSTEY